MRLRYRFALLAAFALVLVLGSPNNALAYLVGFSANLQGSQEVPPNASPATGTAILIYDTVANTLTTNITFSGLLAGLTASHIHGPAAPGVNAGVLHGFPTTPLGSMSGSYSDVWSGLTATQVGYLNTGQLYVNLHTSLYPGGEIRGQILSDPTPTRPSTWGRIKALYRDK